MFNKFQPRKSTGTSQGGQFAPTNRFEPPSDVITDPPPAPENIDMTIGDAVPPERRYSYTVRNLRNQNEELVRRRYEERGVEVPAVWDQKFQQLVEDDYRSGNPVFDDEYRVSEANRHSIAETCSSLPYSDGPEFDLPGNVNGHPVKHATRRFAMPDGTEREVKLQYRIAAFDQEERQIPQHKWVNPYNRNSRAPCYKVGVAYTYYTNTDPDNPYNEPDKEFSGEYFVIRGNVRHFDEAVTAMNQEWDNRWRFERPEDIPARKE